MQSLFAFSTSRHELQGRDSQDSRRTPAPSELQAIGGLHLSCVKDWKLKHLEGTSRARRYVTDAARRKVVASAASAALDGSRRINRLHVNTARWRPGNAIGLVMCDTGDTSVSIVIPIVTIRYDTIDDLHWKSDRQAASLI